MDELNKILIVDDERLNINVLADLLKPNYKIMAAISGVQALKAARSANPPDLILLDIMMPELDGYEVCRQLKAEESTREIPVIFVTAMGQGRATRPGGSRWARPTTSPSRSPPPLSRHGSGPSSSASSTWTSCDRPMPSSSCTRSAWSRS